MLKKQRNRLSDLCSDKRDTFNSLTQDMAPSHENNNGSVSFAEKAILKHQYEVDVSTQFMDVHFTFSSSICERVFSKAKRSLPDNRWSMSSIIL